MNRFTRLIPVYGGVFLLFTGIFLGLFHSPLKASEVFFYRGLIYLGILFVFSLVGVGVLFGIRKIEKPETWIAALCIAASINLSAFIVFPVTFDRSVTMYILDTLHKGKSAVCRGLPRDALRTAVIDGYIIGGDAVEKRLREQREIDMVREQNGCFEATPRAGRFLYFANFIGGLYNIETSY